MAEELRAGTEQVWYDSLAQILKAGAMLWRDAVPVFGGPVVQIIDTVQVHVLRVPAGTARVKYLSMCGCQSKRQTLSEP